MHNPPLTRSLIWPVSISKLTIHAACLNRKSHGAQTTTVIDQEPVWIINATRGSIFTARTTWAHLFDCSAQGYSEADAKMLPILLKLMKKLGATFSLFGMMKALR